MWQNGVLVSSPSFMERVEFQQSTPGSGLHLGPTAHWQCFFLFRGNASVRVRTTDARRLCDHNGMADSYPRIATVVLDTRDARRLAEFYRELFGLKYRESDEAPRPGESDAAGHPFCIFVG